METTKSRRPTLVDWDWFTTRAKPILDRYVEQTGVAPTTLQLQADGHGWICSAAHNHGGYHACLMRWQIPLPGKPSLKDWNEFQRRVRPIVQKYVDRDGFPPSTKQLFRDGYAWIPRAAWNYYEGWEAALRRMQYEPRPLPQTGTGLSNPANFDSAFLAAVTAVRSRVKRTPTRRDMEQAGYRGLLAAAQRAHGGYVHNLRRHGFILGPGQARSPVGFWSNRSLQITTLRRVFPREMRLRVMPAQTAIRRMCPALHRYLLSLRVPWPKLTSRYGLIPWRQAAPAIRYLDSVAEALRLYQQLARWPKAAECSYPLRDLRFRTGITWVEGLTRTDLRPEFLEELAQTWREHVRWVEKIQPQHARERRRCLNRIVIALNGHAPSPHSS